MCFDNNFYFNKSIYLFFLHNLNNFVNIRTPVVERWLIQMKRLVAAPALLVLSRVLFTIESTNPLRSGWRGGGLHRYDSISTTIYIFIYYSGPIFVKLSKDFNLSCYLRLLWRKKNSQWNTWNLRRPSIKLVYKLARFFIFHIVFKFILKLFCLFLWLTKGT